MRVGTNFFYQGVQKRLLRLSSELKNLNEKIATGKRLARPSDDPVAFADAMQFKTALAQFDQYGRTLSAVSSWLNLSESVLTQTLDLAGTARQVAVQMASDTQTAESRALAAAEIGHLLDQAVSLGNTQLGGRYLFSGYRTDTVPFTRTAVGGVENAQYNGDTNSHQVLIGEGETLVAGRDGGTVFMDSNLFETLGTLKKALEENDRAALEAQLGRLSAAEDHLNAQIADIGARAGRVEARQGVIQSFSYDLREKLSLAEDTDLSGAVVQLKTKELAYQAAMAAAARVHELTLLNYIR